MGAKELASGRKSVSLPPQQIRRSSAAMVQPVATLSERSAPDEEIFLAIVENGSVNGSRHACVLRLLAEWHIGAKPVPQWLALPPIERATASFPLPARKTAMPPVRCGRWACIGLCRRQSLRTKPFRLWMRMCRVALRNPPPPLPDRQSPQRRRAMSGRRSRGTNTRLCQTPLLRWLSF